MSNSGRVIVSRNKNTAVIWGDSYTSKNFVSGTDSYNSRQGYWTWANVLSGQRLTLLNNAGVFGQGTAQILARFATDVALYSPGWVVIMAGTNDVASTGTVASITANLASMIASASNIGAQVILCTIPPRSALTGGQKAVQVQCNRWIRAQGVLPGVTVIDVWQTLIDPATGQILAALTNDGIHVNDTGAQRIGRLMATVISQLVAPVDILGHSTDDPLLLIANPNLTGTAGSLSTGVTGSVATSWTTAPVGTSTVVASKVARTDGLPGEFQQYAVSQGGIVHSQVNNGLNTVWFPGVTSVYAVCEFQMDSGDTSLTNLRLQVQAYNASFQTTGQVEDFQFIAGDTYAAESHVANGVLRTPTFLVPATTDLRILVAATYTGIGTIRFGRIGFYKTA